MQPPKTHQTMPLPVQDNRDLSGWPGTIPPNRMKIMLNALKTGRDPQSEHILIDLEMFREAQECR